ncbi:MAG: dTMP kinase [Anaerolineae bacterium]
MSLFLTFEGPEGSGKTTQTQLLRDALQQQGYQIVCTREPGGTLIGEQIRTIVHDRLNSDLVSEAEILLYSAARAQHVAQVIRPALAQGAIVISDRYAESTIAYQGYGRGLNLDTLHAITQFATGGVQPDLVIYLDLDVLAGLDRKRQDQAQGKGEWNRMDDQSLAFYRRVRDGYLAMAEQAQARWLLVDAVLPVLDIHRTILVKIQSLIAAMT